jgi:hypothetical protein
VAPVQTIGEVNGCHGARGDVTNKLAELHILEATSKAVVLGTGDQLLQEWLGHSVKPSGHVDPASLGGIVEASFGGAVMILTAQFEVVDAT